MRIALVFAALVATACSSSTTTSAPACNVEGNWSLSYALGSGTCGFKDAQRDTTVTITKTSPTAVFIEFQGAGGGCSGKLDACKITVKCDGTTTSGLNETRQDSWTIAGTKLTGETDFAYSDPKSPQSCTDNETVSGTKE